MMVSFLRRLYTGIVLKTIDELHFVVVGVFCQNKAKTVGSFHRCLVYDNHGCTQALIITPDSLKKLISEMEPGFIDQK